MTWSTERRTQNLDWFLYLLVIGVVLVLPLAVQMSNWVPEAHRLLYASCWAGLAGALLGRSRLSGWLAWVIGLLVGLLYSLQFAGRLLPGLGLLLDDASAVWAMLTGGSTSARWPFAYSVGHMIAQGDAMIRHLAGWVNAIQQDSVTLNNTPLWLAVSLAIWLLTFNAVYELFRSKRPFMALIPLGVGVVANVSFTDLGMVYVYLYLAITLVALAWANMERLEAFWVKTGLDFSPELKRDVLIAGTGLTTLIVVVALLMPYVTYKKAIYFFWNRVGPSLEQFYGRLDRAFAGRNPIPDPTPSARARSLPSHEVSGGLPPGDNILFMVQTSDPVPLPEELGMWMHGMTIEDMLVRRYWRQRAYDRYTGWGWDSDDRNSRNVEQGAPWAEITYPHTVVTQTFSLLDASGDLAFAVNEPVWVDAHYRVLMRSGDDLAAFGVNDKTYSVVSYVPSATATQLREAEGAYPDWVQERYLQLPQLPRRIHDLAAGIVEREGATTRYDQARAIETYIREFDYDLEIEPPPPGKDVVDYFLFDVKRGYCDYSATAMTVMLRSLGVAARYVSGYGPGAFDFSRSAWVVRELNAHAWVEVYFPGYGWIEFEPTPTQRIFYRADTTWDYASSAPQPEQRVRREFRIPTFWLWVAGVLIVLAFVIIWPPRWFGHAPDSHREAIWQVYEQLVRRARWLELTPSAGQTPREYMAILAREIGERATFAESAPRDIALISESYQRARYSDEPITSYESYNVQRAWRRLRPVFNRLLFMRSR
ncbi:MAG: transglutaminase domain-containing protein [Chloroflexi bacterium]|nr:transglutaminase domain-containing protein [Chloroflexota bacterium]